MQQSAAQELYLLHEAGTPLIVLRTDDPLMFLSSLPQATTKNTDVLWWGLGRPTWQVSSAATATSNVNIPSATWLDPINALKALCTPHGSGTPHPRLILFALGLGPVLSGPTAQPPVVQAVLDGIMQWKASGITLVLVQSPGFTITGYLSRYVQYCDVPLPDEEDLGRVVAETSPVNAPARVHLAKNLKGLTQWEAEQTIAVEHIRQKGKKIQPEALIRAKEALINSTPALRLITDAPSMDHVKGLGRLKRFLTLTAESPEAKGVCILGVQGVGKSMSAQALAAQLQVPLIELNLSAAFGGVVGQSEAQIREALHRVTALRPCVLFIDEIEKVLSGTQSSGRTDGGTTSRVATEFLRFLQDRPPGIYVVATCNDVASLPPEYLRAERWDAIFFADLPTQSERTQILEHYRHLYGLDGDLSVSAADLEGWTGAEIRSLARIAAMSGKTLVEAKEYVIPISTTRREEIEVLRSKWGPRCVPASDPEGAQVQVAPQTGRRLN